MDFIEALAEELLERVAPKVADAVLTDIAARIKQDLVFRYSEKDAAKLLGISQGALADLRKDHLIEFTHSIIPTFDDEGRPHGGRISYLPRHLTEYLERNEIKRHFGRLKAA